MKKRKLNHPWAGVLTLAVFFGWFGVHRLAVGKIATWILMMITLGGLGIWWIIDIILILSEKFTDDKDRPFKMFVPV